MNTTNVMSSEFQTLCRQEVAYCKGVARGQQDITVVVSALKQRCVSELQKLVVALYDPEVRTFDFAPHELVSARLIVDALLRGVWPVFEEQLIHWPSASRNVPANVPASRSGTISPFLVEINSPETTRHILLQLEASYHIAEELSRLETIAGLFGKEMRLGDTNCHFLSVVESLRTVAVCSQIVLSPTDERRTPIGADILLRFHSDGMEFGVIQYGSLETASLATISWPTIVETCSRQLFAVCSKALLEKEANAETVARTKGREPPTALRRTGQGLIELARSELFKCFQSQDINTPEFPQSDETEAREVNLVNITIRNHGRLRASKDGHGTTLVEAVRNGVRRAVSDVRFGGPLLREEAQSVRLEVFLQTAGEQVGFHEILNDPGTCEGEFGIQIDARARSGYFKPTVPVTLGIRKAENLLIRLCNKAAIPHDAVQGREASVFKTQWLHFVEGSQPGECFEFSRNRHRRTVQVTRDSIEAAMCAAAAQTVRSQQADGLFCYRYDAIRDQVLPSSPNVVRMAGCAYGLSRLAGALSSGPPDKQNSSLTLTDIQFAAEKCVLAILGKCRSLPSGRGLYVLERHKGKGLLGCSALLSLALQEVSFRDRFSGIRSRIIEGMLSLQQLDGSFACTFHDANDRRSEDYFPSEAMFAIAREAAITNDNRLIESLEAAFPYYRRHFSDAKSSAFVPWHVHAWRTAFEITKRREYLDFVIDMLGWLCQHQLTSETARSEDFVGGFDFSGRSPHRMPNVSSTVYVEALIRGSQLARQNGDRKRETRFAEASRLGLGFIQRLQLNPVDVLVLPAPQLALGGVTRDLASYEIRCDNNQHFITCMLAALETEVV